MTAAQLALPGRLAAAAAVVSCPVICTPRAGIGPKGSAAASADITPFAGLTLLLLLSFGAGSSRKKSWGLTRGPPLSSTGVLPTQRAALLLTPAAAAVLFAAILLLKWLLLAPAVLFSAR
jgi:hypothetical protein